MSVTTKMHGPLDGVLVVDKPVGPTSHDVVARLRRALDRRRIGHTGTLDPLASGVLPLVIGRATRLASYLSGADKEYEATIRFGIETDTFDAAGDVMQETGAVPSVEAVGQALAQFRGVFEQVPPIYSAKKVDGDRAYARARRAESVTLRPVRVRVDELELMSFEPPCVRLRIVCSSGFYVRSLAHDLGALAGTGARLEALERTRVGSFTLKDALPLERLLEDARVAAGRIVPLEHLLPHVAAVTLTDDGARRARHGQDVGRAETVGPMPAATLVRLMTADGRLLGLAEPAARPGFLHPAVVFD